MVTVHKKLFQTVLIMLLAAFAAVCVPAQRARGQCDGDPPFGWQPGQGMPGGVGGVLALTVLPDGNVIAGGIFTTIWGVPAKQIARYNPSTGVWSALGSGVDGDYVSALVVLPNSDVIVGGNFTAAGGVPAKQIARYNPSTGVWSALGSGVDGDYVSALVVLPNGDVIVGGNFTAAGGVPAKQIARYNPSTGVWSALGSGVDGVVNVLEVLPDGDILVGGYFTSAGGVAANSIARYNPSSHTWAPLGSGVNATVYSLAVLPGGDVIVGGHFDTAGGELARNITRYNPTSGTWSALGGGGGVNNDYVFALSVLPGGDVIVGGFFSTTWGVLARNIVRYNPTSEDWSNLGSGVDRDVFDLAALPNGDLVAGGSFNHAGGSVSVYFARYTFASPAPSIDIQPTSVTTCLSPVAFSIAASGIGPFTYEWQLQIAPDAWITLNNDLATIPCGASGSGTAFASPINSSSVTIGVEGCSDVNAATRWNIRCVVSDACGSVISHPAVITICQADFNCSGGISVQDIFDFLIAWFSGYSSADFNHVGGVTVQDIFDFLTAWFVGC